MESLVDDVVMYPDVIAARLNRMFPWSFISFENITLFIKHYIDIIKQLDTRLIKWYIFSNNLKSSKT